VILRVLNFVVIGALVLAAAYVYRIKYEAIAQAERLDKLRDEVRHERDKIAALRAQWGELDNPARIEALAKRFLKLKPVEATQFDDLDHLPDQPPDYMRPGTRDPIGGIIEHLKEPVAVTSSITTPPVAAAHTGDALSPASGISDGMPEPAVAAAPPASGAHSP
jgi:cell division protein FtsL